ncbi:sugar phosphate isomerase [Emticicia aquatilis]|uniref:Sugar phosphate isomerase n=1 Tax=Emticicia aquatilis TaxID=1537369 RepID=A0A916YDF1_9BACT|nr:metabolite traffic protein EboE [Emticicia aquatilis]GGD40790.1 sugar phosphate isomerase [Emticicia aquatilis]
MQTPYGHLSYCSNIHPGEDWDAHFSVLQRSIPEIKAAVFPNEKMGIGLRLANQASIDLSEKSNFDTFKNWLEANDCYVFTMNGFPYGGFHNVVVKDQVHAPDWTTTERTNYTIRSFSLLAQLLPTHLTEGGISTSPLSYRFWWKTADSLEEATKIATRNMILVVESLIEIKATKGKILHLDIEPEPDGILENSDEYIAWYNNYLLPMGIEQLVSKGFSSEQAAEAIKTHIQLCYDVCHFAVGFEAPQVVIDKLESEGLKVGKIQISSALKIDFSSDAEEKLRVIAQYNEPTYLHQVVAQRKDGSFQKFPDLTEAIEGFDENIHSWKVHFHVPLFLENYGVLSSTQSDIVDTINVHKNKPFTNHLEIETYTWGVLPTEFQAPLNESIIREINWVKGLL